MKTKTIPIRVLIAEDSLVARELLGTILQSDPGLQVVGMAHNGAEAVRLAKQIKPDVITMDVYMPEMDGLEATRHIMTEAPRPIIIVSANVDKKERNLTFNALQAGALSVIEKPTMYGPPELHEALVSQVKLMSEVKVVRHWNKLPGDSSFPQSPVLKRNGRSKIQVVTIASSTGGPNVLAEILGKLPAKFPAPILIVQHITPGFAAGLASWLNQQTPLKVRLARHADEAQAGQVFIAGDGYHMVVNSIGLISLNKTPPYQGLRPAANNLFNSVAQVYGDTAIGVILSGMGRDGAKGLQAMRKTGAHTIVQNEDTCVVFGMPAVAIELGAAEQILPANKIADAIMALAPVV